VHREQQRVVVAWCAGGCVRQHESSQVTIREARDGDAPGIARVHVDSWRTTYRGIVPDDLLARLSTERRERYWADVVANPNRPEFVYVAEAAGEIAGFAAGGPEESGRAVYTGELYAIYLLERFQGRGIGRGLTLEVMRRLVAVGHQGMLLWVLADNPACRYYETIGGVRIDSKMETFGGVTLEEVAFGWPNLAAAFTTLERPPT
jgi:GNAT superfamily N-acetyltransferase